MTGGITPTDPNRNLYNGGSEWQNDFGELPDLMQTYYRNYDQALGRWTGVDPDAEGLESLTSYNYSGNNPVMYNDPLGNLNEKEDKDKDNNGTVLPEVTIVGEPIHHDPFFSFLTGGAISIGGGWINDGGNDLLFGGGSQSSILKPKPGSRKNTIQLKEVVVKGKRITKKIKISDISISDWYDALGKIFAGENLPLIFTQLSKDAKITNIGIRAGWTLSAIGLILDYMLIKGIKSQEPNFY